MWLSSKVVDQMGQIQYDQRQDQRLLYLLTNLQPVHAVVEMSYDKCDINEPSCIVMD